MLREPDRIGLFIPYGPAADAASANHDFVLVGRYGRTGWGYIVRRWKDVEGGITADLQSGRELEPGETFPTLDVPGVRKV